uniref:Uncharacterized protein n=1 Tax=Anopheles albimanus TaxID=7167 RepID=A0A182FYH6_ANOAL
MAWFLCDIIHKSDREWRGSSQSVSNT